MSRPERPWMPGPHDTHVDFALINPEGDRHIGFVQRDGCWYRLWQGRQPELFKHAGEAILLRPSEIGEIIKISMAWVTAHPGHPHGADLVDQIAAGAKTAVAHLAGLSQGRG